MSDGPIQPAGPPSGTPGRNLLATLFPAGLLLALTLAAYHPLTWQLGSKTTGGRVDRYIFLWDLWWARHALFHLQASPFNTDFLFYPEGCSLAYHTLCLANGLLGLLAGPSADLILTYNLLLLLSTFLGGFFTFLLLRSMSGSAPGALPGGVIFAFSPPVWTAINHGQMNLWSAHWMPLSLWCLVRFLRHPGGRRAVPLALSLALVFYTGFQQFVFTGLLALIIAAAELLGQRRGEMDRRNLARGAAAGLLLLLLLAAPLALEMVRSGDGAMIEPGREQLRGCSFGPARYFTQSRNRWWRHWKEEGRFGPLPGTLDRVMPRRGPMFGYGTCLLIAGGWVVLLLRRRISFPVCYWSLMTALLAWLPLGTDAGLLLLGNLPGLSGIRAIYRFCLPLALAVAILSAVLCRALLGELPDRSEEGGSATSPRAAAWKWSLCLLLTLLTYLEFFKAPLSVRDPPPVPAPYLAGGAVSEAGADGGTTGALIELPYWTAGGDFWLGEIRYETLYFQTFHRMRIIGGHHSRLTGDQVPGSIFDPTLVFLAARRPENSSPPSVRQARETFRRLRIRFANLDRSRYTRQGEALVAAILEAELGGELIHGDRRFLTYRFDPERLPPPAPFRSATVPVSSATSAASARWCDPSQ